MVKRQPKRTERTVRREQERKLSRLQGDRERLFALEPGGRIDHPIAAASAGVIEAHAAGVPCPRCRSNHELIEHAALVHAGVRLRETKLRCRQCGSTRSLWFKIVANEPN